jgi:hypothetical protein
MSERNYGLITDRLAWDLPLTGLTSLRGPFQVFSASGPTGAPGPFALARTDGIGVYRRWFPEGGGENGLHSHGQSAAWFVVDGRAQFYQEGGELIATLDAHQGVMVPESVPYRFICLEPSLLLRFAGG